MPVAQACMKAIDPIHTDAKAIGMLLLKIEQTEHQVRQPLQICAQLNIRFQDGQQSNFTNLRIGSFLFFNKKPESFQIGQHGEILQKYQYLNPVVSLFVGFNNDHDDDKKDNDDNDGSDKDDNDNDGSDMDNNDNDGSDKDDNDSDSSDTSDEEEHTSDEEAEAALKKVKRLQASR